jgi:hypothetical protein
MFLKKMKSMFNFKVVTKKTGFHVVFNTDGMGFVFDEYENVVYRGSESEIREFLDWEEFVFRQKIHEKKRLQRKARLKFLIRKLMNLFYIGKKL